MSTTDFDLSMFLSNGRKLYIQMSNGMFSDKSFHDAEVVDKQNIDMLLGQKFDLILLPYTLDVSVIKKSINLLADNGKLVFCVENFNIAVRILWWFNTCLFKMLLKHMGLTKSYFSYLSPGFGSTVQVVSSHRFLSQQYFRQHYAWPYTTQQSTIKRVIKYFVFKTNTFYLVEQSCILGFQK